MLQLRPNCECCNRDLSPESPDALICSFECTFCRNCATDILRGKCPNCGGELVTRPRRPADRLAKYPASSERVYKPAIPKVREPRGTLLAAKTDGHDYGIRGS